MSMAVEEPRFAPLYHEMALPKLRGHQKLTNLAATKKHQAGTAAQISENGFN